MCQDIIRIDKDWFLVIDDLVKSKLGKHEDGTFVCMECGKTSKWKTNIWEHIEGLHIENHPGYACDFCNKYCKTKNALRSHRNREHKQQWIKFWNLLGSEYIELGDGTFSCLLCAYPAPTRQRILFHMEAKHSNGPGYQCDLCDKHCPTLNALRSHKSRHHKGKLQFT